MSLEEKADKLIKFLVEHPEIPSVSPATGLSLMQTLERLEEAIPKVEDEELRRLLRTYANGFKVVTAFAVIHQGVVIKVLELAIEGRAHHD